MGLPKILICSPTYEGKNYCVDAWVKNVYGFHYPKSKYDVFLADNSKTNENAKMMRDKYRINTHWKDYGDMNAFERLAEGHNICRDKFLDGEYDYMLHLETDVFPEPNALIQLLSARKDVVAGTYHISGGGTRIPVTSAKPFGQPFGDSFTQSVNLGYTPHFFDGSVRPATQVGLGCTLLHKRVLQEQEFRWEVDRAYQKMVGANKFDAPAPDTFFFRDLMGKNIPIYAHTGVHCFHWNREDWGTMASQVNQSKTE